MDNVKRNFITKTREYIINAENSDSKDTKCMWCMEVLKLVIKYSFYMFDMKNEDCSRYRATLKDKLYELKDEKGFESAEKLNKLSLHILKRYYGECLNENRCIAYKMDNTRCRKAINHSNVCKIHVRYHNKIIKLLSIYLHVDISKKCVDLLF